MTQQNYTPEEAAFKAEIENLAQNIQPDTDFVAQLEKQLVKSELLASTKTVSPPKPQRAPLWFGFRGWAGAVAMLMILIFGGFGLFFLQSRSNQSQNGDMLYFIEPSQSSQITSLENLDEQGNLERDGFNDQDQMIAAAPPTNTPVVLATSTPMLTMPPTPTPAPIMAAELAQEDDAAMTYRFSTDETTLANRSEADGAASPLIPSSESLELQSSQSAIRPTPLPLPTETPAPNEIPPADMFFEEYSDNPFLDTEDEHLSTFAMDVDTASYTLARSYLLDLGQHPPPEAIRIEEFVNYFDAEYPGPTNDEEAFTIHLDAAPAPFGFENHQLLRVGIQGRTITSEERDPALLIFVIDVSGSMDQDNRLGLVKEALALLVDELTEADRIAIAVYSDNSRVVLYPTSAANRQTIMDAINALRPEGSTNVDAGLQLGYQIAETHQRPEQNTRVIVLSDGVANVDVVTPEGILANIQRGVERDITLSTIGFGMGNYNDVLMEQLANDGNGNYYYVDNLRQARRIFVQDLTGTLQVIGYDAKIQVEFNPAVTDRYRLMGYENRALAAKDFRNDTVDAGEVGAGHNVTALYEIALEQTDLLPSDVIATAYIRYEDADTREVVELNRPITVGELRPSIEAMPLTFRLHAAAAEFAELLGQSYWAEEGSFDELLDFTLAIETERPNNIQVIELVEMIQQAREN